MFLPILMTGVNLVPRLLHLLSSEDKSLGTRLDLSEQMIPYCTCIYCTCIFATKNKAKICSEHLVHSDIVTMTMCRFETLELTHLKYVTSQLFIHGYFIVIFDTILAFVLDFIMHARLQKMDFQMGIR